MARGNSDYNVRPFAVASSSVDLGALVTAIRGINSIDNRGRILLLETFSEGLFAWQLSKTGAGAYPVVTLDKAEVPPVCVYFSCGNSGGLDLSTIFRDLYPSGGSRFGIEFGVRNSSDLADLYLIGDAVDYGYEQEAKVLFSPSANTLTIYSADGNRVISGLPNQLTATGWFPIKIVFDISLQQYVSLLYGTTRIDLTGLALTALSESTSKRALSVTVTAKRNGTGVDQHVGHVIFTQDEL